MENERLTDIKQLEGAIEAILFAAGHPMEYSKLGEVLGLTPRDTKQLVMHLAERWGRDENGKGKGKATKSVRKTPKKTVTAAQRVAAKGRKRK